MWPGFEIGSITNGAHVPTWKKTTPHAENKRALIEYVRRRTGVALEPDRLTIGFTRRFATYKRATLLFSEPDRLAEVPVQVVVSGKAHPADEGGKELIAQITALARDPRFAGRIAFIPNYNMEVASYVTSGADVWLNNPRRPMEASGTSGMKAAMNGVLNLSVLDGWWPEAYSPDIGWAIPGESDDADREELYRLLEEEVVPVFYDDSERWERMMDVNGGKQPSTEQMFWAGLSGLFYLPATVAPAGLTPDGLPVGVQIVGAQYRDHDMIRFAQLLEREYRGFVPPPGWA